MCEIEMSCTLVCGQEQAIGWKKSVCLPIPFVCSYGEFTRSLRDVVTTNCFAGRKARINQLRLLVHRSARL